VQAGAYFYHGHDGFQKLEGVNGALIVRSREKKEAFDYDGEFNLLLSDWWQKNTHQPQVNQTMHAYNYLWEKCKYKFKTIVSIWLLLEILSRVFNHD